MLNANPPKLPEKDFFQRYMTMLMKFDNRFPFSGCLRSDQSRDAMIGLQAFAQEYEITFDPAFQEKVDAYMKEAELRACFSSEW